MPDITMCINNDCSLRDNCYRYRAVPSPYRQAYSRFFDKPCIHQLTLDGDGYIPPLRSLEEADSSVAQMNDQIKNG